MAKQQGQKLRLLYLLDILKKYSNEEHPLNANEICQKLSSFGIEAERKTIYDDIACLCDYGIDIIKASSNRGGWFIGEREFETSEIYLLCDAVRAAEFISANKTRHLLSKLKSSVSVYDFEKFENTVYFNPLDKCQNEEIYYNIDFLSTAIKMRKKVKFSYSSRYFSEDRTIAKKIKEITVSPYALTWQDDRYYLICNHSKYDNLLHLRLDRINRVEILEESNRPFSEVSPYTDFFNTADYTKKLFSMHGGALTEVEFCCHKSIAEQVLDRFGENIFIKNVTENTFSFSTKVNVSQALITWIINYGNSIKIVKPQNVKDMIIKRAQSVLKNYSEE